MAARAIMRMHLDRSPIRILLVPILWVALVPHPATSQERAVVFNQVSVSGSEANLLLEFDGGEELSIEFENGTVSLNDDAVGPYTPGGDLETSWRSLLSRAVALEPSQLSELLADWTPPAGTSAESRPAAEAIAGRLGEALAGGATALDPAEQAPDTAEPVSGIGGDSALATLLRQSDRLRELAFALEDLDVSNLDVRLGESYEIEEDRTVDATVLMVDGTLDLEGTIDGDVVLVGARLDLGSDARVTGSVRSAGGVITGDRDAIAGGVLEVAADSERVDRDESDIADAVRAAVREARRDEASASARSRGSAFRNIGDGLGDLLQTLLTFGLMLAIGLGVLYFFPRQFEIVSRTASNATGRSLLVGLAGMVLALPVFILGIVFLAVSIIGIPLLLAWIPLAPFVFASAVVFGMVAIARNLGRWISGHEAASFDGLDASRPAVQLGWGLALLLGSFAVSNIFEMGGPWFGAFEGILILVGSALLTIAICVGLGAVILSKAGRDGTHAAPDRGVAGPEASGAAGGPDAL